MRTQTLLKNNIKRRTFLGQVGGGITVLFTVDFSPTIAQRRGYPDDFNAYLRIHKNGRISCFTGKIEMGQGIITSLAQMLAEELDVNLANIDMVMGDTILGPYDGGTTGSRSTKYFGPALRKAGAEAKRILLELAAEKLAIPKDQLVVKNGRIFSANDPSNQLTFAELANGQKINRHVEYEISPETSSEHTISGQSFKRTDSIDKVTGQAQFTGDIRLPGMLYAKVLKPNFHNAEPISVDTKAAKAVPGVIVVQEEGLIAVLHEKPDVAEEAINLIKVVFSQQKSIPDNDSIFDHLTQSATTERTVTENGSLENGKNISSKTIKTDFYNHYVAHSPLETHTILVDAHGSTADVWSATQAPFRIQSTIADTLGISKQNVHVRTPFVGGGFGGKKTGRLVNDAALLSKKTGKPVQISWDRKEEFFYDTFRPAAVIKAHSGIDKDGKITFWEFDHYFSGTRSSGPIYNIPHYHVKSKSTTRGEESAHPFSTGAWRGPGSNTNVFAMESQTDIMAQTAGMDPLEFRYNNLSDDRMKNVLDAAAKKFNRKFTLAPGKKGYGIACTNYLNTYVVTMAEIAVNPTSGQITVKRIVCAQDMGEIINPQGAVIQIEGGLTMGLGYCLTEEIQFAGQHIRTENFDDYEIPKFSWVPQIEVELVNNPKIPPQGCGEAAITTMGAVLANAVYDAIGIRMYTLPMTANRVLNAIKES
jgi:nicotinate dehydrogenase subunit B